MDLYTEDLSKFGGRERHMAGKLLSANLPDGFDNSGVRVAMNMGSGYVFLVNEDFQVAMMNGNEMEIWHTTPYSGHEGFAEELETHYAANPEDWHSDDVEYLVDQGIIEQPEEDESEESE